MVGGGAVICKESIVGSRGSVSVVGFAKKIW